VRDDVVVTEPTIEELRDALAQHASRTGAVFPSALKLINAERHWSGRLWDVLTVIASDLDVLRYEAGGDRADEIASCAGRWAETPLSLEEITLVLAAGGYDPDPFVVLHDVGLLHQTLLRDDGELRSVGGERVGAWISDELALASADEIVEKAQALVRGRFG
jgi:hypothetical protein